MTDAEIEEFLVDSSELLLSGNSNRRLLEVLLSEFGTLDQAFVIHWIPEQGEDIYTVAVPPRTIATVEIPRDDSEANTPAVEKVSFEEYRRQKLGKEIRRKLDILRKLLR